MSSALRRLERLVPQPMVAPARSLVARFRMAAGAAGLRRRVHPVRWGSLRRLRPISARYGFDRGTPVDRRLLDAFFASHAGDIRGRVIEVAAPAFSGRFATRVEHLDLLDIDPTNDRATIVADLSDPGCLPQGSFDCVIVPQTLQYVRDLRTACDNLWAALAPGGVLLVSVPTIAKLDHHLRDVDRWRLTPTGLATLLADSCPGGEVEVTGGGNVLTATAFLMGVSAEELDDAELLETDPDFPVVALARVRRPA